MKVGASAVHPKPLLVWTNPTFATVSRNLSPWLAASLGRIE